MKFYIGLLTVLLIGLLVPTQNAWAEELTEDQEVSIQAPLNLSPTEIKNLKSLGFSEEEINNMSDEEFEINKDLKGEIIENKTKYYKVYETSEEETSNTTFLRSNKAATSIIKEEFKSTSTTEVELSPKQYYDEIENVNLNEQINKPVSSLANSASKSKSTAYKTMTVTVSKLSTGKYRLKVNVHWDKKMPSNRKIDVLGVGFNNTQWRPAYGEYGKQTWKIFNTKTRTNTTGSAPYASSSNKWKYGKDAYTLRMNLKDDPSSKQKVTDINMYMYYTVTPSGSLPKYLDAFGQYSHQETYTEITPTINFDGTGGFSISNSTKFTHSYVQATLKTK